MCDALTAEDSSVNVSDESNEQVYSSVGILTKYPDDGDQMFIQPQIYDLPDEIRMRRKTDETHSSNNGSQKMLKDVGQNKEEPAKVPLQGVITAIETDLVTTALLANTQLHKRQSTSNAKAENGTIDANENLFEDLFNFTRPERETDGKENMTKIPLNGIVSAVESTLINAAQNLKDGEQPNISAKLELNSNSSSDSNGTHRLIDRDTNDESVQIQTLNGIQSTQNLNILNSIAFKPILNDTEMDNATTIDDDITVSVTEHPDIQRTNFTVIQASDAVSLVPDGENKLAHVQHQAISKTVFQSNLAVFPMIAPKSLTTPLPSNTSVEQTSKEEINENRASTSNATNNTLKEKIAEVQAEPVILSSFP